MTAINATLQSFFTDRLTRQKDASTHTIAAYRDTLRLLLGFIATTHEVTASSLQWNQLDAPEITAFLDHLQKDRGNGARTRNARLSAIHSLFRYAALHHPEHAASIARVLAIPPQRVDRHLVDYLDDDECEALLAAPDHGTWTGRRDHTFLVVALQPRSPAVVLSVLGRDPLRKVVRSSERSKGAAPMNAVASVSMSC